jgi:hypothetical protein
MDQTIVPPDSTKIVTTSADTEMDQTNVPSASTNIGTTRVDQIAEVPSNEAEVIPPKKPSIFSYTIIK